MSTVKATHFEHPSSAVPGITLGSDGSVVLPSGFTGGLGTNVVQTVKTDTFSTAVAASFVPVTGLSVSITPTSSTSKILVLAVVPVGSNLTDVRWTVGGTIFRGATNLSAPSGSSSRSKILGAMPGRPETSPLALSMKFLDSPATTSSITYSVSIILNGTSGTTYVNRGADFSDIANIGQSVATITAIEVAA